MRSFLLWAASALFSGCVSLPPPDTARTLGADEVAADFTLVSGAFSEVSLGGPRDPASQDSTYDPIQLDYVPVLTAGVTRGLGSRTDVGVHITSTTFVGGHLKHQFTGTATSRFAAALRVDAGVNTWLLGIGGGLYGHGSASAVVSYHPSAKATLFAAPRYTAVGVTVPGPLGRPDGRWMLGSVAYGVAVGESNRLVFEVTHARSGSVLPSQATVGYRHRLR